MSATDPTVHRPLPASPRGGALHEETPITRLHYTDLMDPDDLSLEIDSGYVRVRYNAQGHALFCYTEQAQFERHWNEVTRQCRGLVIDRDGFVIARPFDKFFNHTEEFAPEIELDAQVTAYDKLDGSMVFYVPGHGMATKGSFSSDQAKRAQEILEEKYPHWEPAPGVTYIFELIDPSNQVVLNYGGKSDLYLLAMREISTGMTLTPPSREEWAQLDLGPSDWPGPIAERLTAGFTEPFADVLARPPRENAEGMVVVTGGGEFVKLKQEDYLALHRVVTNINSRTIWEAAAVHHCRGLGASADSLVHLLGLSPERIDQALSLGPAWDIVLAEKLPDEFHDWLRETGGSLWGGYLDLEREAYARQEDLHDGHTPAEVVKTLQARAKGETVPWNVSMEMWHNDGDPTPRSRAAIWKLLKPKPKAGTRW